MLVSSIGQSGDSGASLGDGGTTLGQAFSVGADGGNYTLTSIEIPIKDNGIAAADIDSLSVSVWSTNSSGLPSSSLHSLTNPSSIAEDTTAIFNAQAGATLEAGKTYAVVVFYNKSLTSDWPSWAITETGAIDASPATGWDIADSSLFRPSGAMATWEAFGGEAYKMRVNGSAAGGTPTCTLNTGDLWCGVVTVAAISSGGSVAAHGFAGTDGGLDDKTFSVGTNNYTIDGLYVGTAGDLNLDLTGALDAADKGNLKLVVGSTDFDLDDATHVSSENAYLWTGTGLDWSSDTHVTLRLRRAVALSTDATLSGLTVYDGSSNLTLSPTFASGTEAYTAAAAYDIATVTVTATKNQADATVAWLDASDATLADADAMAPGRQVALAAGANTFKVKVTAEDGTTTKTYTVTVNRATPTCSLNTGDLWCGVITVGNGTGFDGYVSASSIGALSDTTFSVGTNNYTIDAIAVHNLGVFAGGMSFSLTSSALSAGDRAKLVVHVGSVALKFSEANLVDAAKTYEFESTGLDWSSESFVTLRLRDTPVANNAPVFSPTTATREVAENSAAGTNVGAVIPEATDSDSGDTLTYSMEGTDAASFAFDASTRQITTITGVTYNHEATKNSYSVTVKASDGTASATIAVTIDVTDVNEKSAKPDKPTLAKVTGSSTSLTATWAEPDLDGGPAIAGYDLQYKVNTATTWEDFAHSGTAVTTTVTGLTADTSYQVQVRAKNGETDSDWSDPSDAVKTNAEMSTPTCTLNTGDIWCGVVTVGDIIVSGVTAGHGFSAIVGELSDKTFDVGTNSYTIDGVIVGSADVGAAGDLTFSLTSALTATDKEKLVLHVGSSSFAFSDAGAPTSTFGYAWPPSSLNWSSETSVTLRLREANNAPVFSPTTATREVAENSAVGTSVGAVVTATDADNDTLTYSLEGTDAASFDIESGTGQIKTKSGVTYDFEAAQNTYEMTVKADDGNGGTDTIEVNIALLDADEKSAKPDKPTLAAVAGSSTSLTATWEKPDLDGGPDIAGYDLQYREGTTGTWEDFAHSDTAVTTTVTGLTADTSYQVQVRAKNGETDSDWSDASDAVKTNAEMSTPTCTLNPGDLWCGVVTVERFVLGVLALDGFGEGEGGLSDTEFTYGTNSYTIDIAANEGTNRILLFSLTSALTAGDRAALELHVDGNSASFAFSAATYNSSAHNYTWTGTGLDWFGTSTVTLRLRAATETDASLNALSVTHSGGSVRLRPAFAPGTVEYQASVANPVDEVTVAATANVAAAEVAYLDGDGAAIADADTNTPGREVALEVGATVVEVKVTAEDGTTMRTYRVTVTRGVVEDLAIEGEFRLAPETVVDYVDPDNDRRGGTGPVEVYHAGAWGTVCRDGIRYSSFSTFDSDPATGALVMDSDGNPIETEQDNEAAALICKAMNYDDGEYHGKYSKFLPDAAEADHQDADYWPPGSSYPADGPKPIWLDELRCVAGDGFVPSADPLPGAMSHCSYAGWGLHNCTHKEDAVVRCWNNDTGGPGLKSLKGRFVSPPERHDGTNRVKVRVAFSEPVEESPENVGAHGVEVEGGEVTSVSPVGGDARDGAGTRSAGGRNAGGEDREVVWEFEIEPDSDGDLTVTLEAGRPCGEPGAICTADGRALSEGISTTVEGPEAPPPLTASFGNMPEAHDGAGAFRFRVAFSENIGISYRSLREDAFAVSGGRVTRGRRVDDRRDLFEMTVEPDGDGEVTVTLPAGRECSVSGAICTKGENRRQLTNAPTATVAGPAVETGPAGLTARFVDMPSEHDGETAFKFRIAFSEEIRMSGRRLRSDVVAVSGGRATKAGRVNRPKDLWKLKVRPDSLADVTVTLSSGAACDTPGAVCTADGRALSNTISATVEGPVAVSVADARVREAAGATLDFAVSLSRAAAGPVSVTWATADGSATAGSDYRAGQGKLRFAPGETEKTIPVPVLDDAHDEGEETMQLRLTVSSGAAIADGVATGTIENTDHMPAAWLARFGRTVTDQVLGAVEARLSAPRAAGARATLAGQALPSWDAANDDATAAADPGTGSGAGVSERGLAARDRDAMTAIRDWMARAGTDGSGAGANGSGADAWRGEGRDDRTRSRALTGRDFLTGTSFALTGGSAEAGGYAALWGRGAISRFDGREGDLTLDGEVTTGLMGADWASAPGSGSRRWTAGLAFGHARGTGGYREGGGCEGESCAGEVEATLTGVWPYAGLTLTDRLSAWAAAGYGAGELKLTPGGETDGPFKADLTMAMGAAGLRGEVLTPPPDGGLALALKGDARFTRTASEATKDAKGGNLAAATADVWLLRTGIEGSRRFALQGDADGMVLTPSFEIGARLDGGDAETGLGVDLGGGLAFAAPRQGVALDLKARGLIAHQASGFREWGASASLTWDPRPTTDRGFALTLRQGWGGSPTGGMDALLRRETLAGLAANDNGDTTASTGRLEAELGYGIALFGGGFTGTPHLGFGLSDTARDYRVGWRLTSARRGDPGFQVDLDATRREAADADAEHGLMLRGTIRW